MELELEFEEALDEEVEGVWESNSACNFLASSRSDEYWSLEEEEEEDMDCLYESTCSPRFEMCVTGTRAGI